MNLQQVEPHGDMLALGIISRQTEVGEYVGLGSRYENAEGDCQVRVADDNLHQLVFEGVKPDGGWYVQ